MEERETVRKVWHAPELTVLVRGRQEEAVLEGCKVSPYSGPHLDYTRCMDPVCTGCTAYVDS
jgi:hypothetical protein